jgi:hypothetical protein
MMTARARFEERHKGFLENRPRTATMYQMSRAAPPATTDGSHVHAEMRHSHSVC